MARSVAEIDSDIVAVRQAIASARAASTITINGRTAVINYAELRRELGDLLAERGAAASGRGPLQIIPTMRGY